MVTFTISFQHTSESPSQSNYARERNKRHLIRKGRCEIICLLTQSYIEKMLKIHQKILEPINKFSKVEENKIYIQQSVAIQ
jgi:hypothetical protein